MTILVGLLNLGRMTTGAVFLYTLFANAFFLVSLPRTEASCTRVILTIQLRSLKYVLLPDPSNASAATVTLSHSQRARRVQFLFVMAVSQVLWMGWLARV